jgi:hypothetical protein
VLIENSRFYESFSFRFSSKFAIFFGSYLITIPVKLDFFFFFPLLIFSKSNSHENVSSGTKSILTIGLVSS